MPDSPYLNVRPNQSQPPEIAQKAVIDGVYMHVPFCFHKCHYCDFYSIVEDDRDRHLTFAKRMENELLAWQQQLAQPLRPTTIFIGGGTPTYLHLDAWDWLIQAFQRLGLAREAVEFTVEANPETVNEPVARRLVQAGVNRASIGAQSFHPHHLKTLERWHDPANVARAVATLRSAGIDNINLDLIFAIPGQTPADVEADLDAALALEPRHLSYYNLTYEPNTALAVKRDQHAVMPVDEDAEAAMYELIIERLRKAGFEHYEISNWARRDSDGRASDRCAHNLMYWRNRNWLGIGPGAAGHVDGKRWKNAPHLGRYLETDTFAPAIDVESLDREGQVGETLMMGLRLLDGIPLDWIDTHIQPGNPRRQTITELINAGLLESTPTHLRLTHQGLLIGDTVVSQLL